MRGRFLQSVTQHSTCFLSLLVAFFLTGCAEDGKHGRVSGTVLMDGEPLPNAQVEFTPLDEGGSTSYGRTDESGRYTMEYARNSPGASLGEHRVKISTGDMTMDENERPVRIQEKVPAQYNLNSDLTFTVEQGSNTADFKLSSEGEIGDTTRGARESGY